MGTSTAHARKIDVSSNVGWPQGQKRVKRVLPIPSFPSFDQPDSAPVRVTSSKMHLRFLNVYPSLIKRNAIL